MTHNCYVLESILDRLYRAELLDIYPISNQFIRLAYRGNGIIIPKEWVIKIMYTGKLVCSNAEFFEYLLSYSNDETLPGAKNEFRSLKNFLSKHSEILPELPEFPNEVSKWVWLAGIIDAECSLSLQKSKKDTRRGFQYIPRLNCSSTTPLLLLQIQKVCHPYGAVSSHHYQDKRSVYWKSTRKFSLSGNGLRKTLPLVLPYLVIKKRQADILIEALELLTHGTKNKVEEQKLVDLWLEVRKLNKRGK